MIENEVMSQKSKTIVVGFKKVSEIPFIKASFKQLQHRDLNKVPSHLIEVTLGFAEFREKNSVEDGWKRESKRRKRGKKKERETNTSNSKCRISLVEHWSIEYLEDEDI